MNIATFLQMISEEVPDRIAIDHGDRQWTFRQWREAAVGLAGALRDRPHRVAALITTSPSFPVALFGTLWSGRVFAPINHRLPAAKVAEMIDHMRPATLVAEPERVAGVPLADIEVIDPAGPHPLEADLAVAPMDADPGDEAVRLFTSGTSAEPKVAILRHGNLAAYVMNVNEFASAGPDEAVLLAVPPFHIAGIAGVVTSCWVGRRIVPLPRFSAADWVRVAHEHRVTHAFLVPTMLSRIVEHLRNTKEPAPRLRTLSYGGARTPLPVLQAALELFPETEFVNAYGLTETSSTISILTPEDHRAAMTSHDPAVRDRLRSAGRPLPGIQVAIRDAAGNPVPAGTRGEVWVRGEQVSGEYAGRASRVDGWFPTGDVGWFDSSGYLFIEGRGDDTIISGGENIAAADVEDVLLSHPAVERAAVVGVPDEEWGQRVAAVVVLRPQAQVTPDDLLAFVRERAGSLKTPRILEFWPALPETPTGKVLKRTIEERLVAHRADDRRTDTDRSPAHPVSR
jgi:acyl-CoA synthetase (AMP-forming)/AMP-acid ligase II